MKSGLYCLVAFVFTLFLGQVQAWRPVVEPKEKITTSEDPKPWRRSIYSSQVELVTPTVIRGVTFSAKPEATPDPLKPWVSLKKEGIPVTIKPKMKNGRVEKASPEYSTYFQTASIHTYTYEDLKAHNMDPNDVHEEEVWADEDKTYVSLNPIIRCTPDRYFHKGLANNIISAPFCTPRENVDLKVGEIYFTTWYTRFFINEDTGDTIDSVRLHMAYVREKSKEFGNHNIKRDAGAEAEAEPEAEPEAAGSRSDMPINDATFFTSEWMKNVDGVYPIEIQQDWLQGEFTRKAVIAIQPSNVPDDEFDPLLHGVMVYIVQGSKVFKASKEQIALEDAGLTGVKWYYIALSLPSAVILACAAMYYFFIKVNYRYRDFTGTTNKALNKKRRVLGKFSEMKKYQNMKNRPYNELPTSYEMKSSKDA